MLILLSGCGSKGDSYKLKVNNDEIYVEMSIQDLLDQGYTIDVDLEQSLEYNTYFKDLIPVKKDNNEVMKIQIGNFSLEDGKVKDGSVKRIEYEGKKIILNDIDYTELKSEEALKKLGENASWSEKWHCINVYDDTLALTLNYKDGKLKSISMDKTKK